MTSINFKVIGLTQPEIKVAESEFKLTTFGFPDLPGWEEDALLIWPPRLVQQTCNQPDIHANRQTGYQTYMHATINR